MSTTSSNPKEEMRGNYRRSRANSFGGVGNPLMIEVKDTEQQKQFYSNWPVVPFHEGADATLDLFELCTLLSPTNGGIITTIRDFVLGGEFEVIRKKRAGLARHKEDMEEVEVSREESYAYWDWVEEVIPGEELLQVATEIFDNFKQYGNAFVEVVVGHSMGDDIATIRSHDAPYCRYLSTLPGENKVVLISPEWSDAYITKYPPIAITRYPQWTEEDTGVKRTIIHLLNKVPKYDWYGMPDWIVGLYSAYQEIQMGEYGSDEYANRLTAQVIVETTDPAATLDEEVAEDDPYLDMQEAMEYLFSNKHGERRRFLHRSKDTQTEQMNVWFVPSNHDHEFHQFMSEVTEKQLMKAHSWHPMLMLTQPGRLGNSSEFKQVLRLKHQTVVRKYQKKIGQVLDLAFRLIEEHRGGTTWTSQYSIFFRNQFEEMMIEDPTVETEEVEETEPTNSPDPEE